MSATLDDRRDVAAIHPLRFWTDYTDAADGSMTPAEWVEWVKKGDAYGATTAEKVTRAQKMPVIWDALRPHYEAWKRNQEPVANGTPLDAVPFVTREMAQAMARVHLRSVEDLAAAEDAALVKLGIPNIRAVQQKARAFLDAQRMQAGVSGELAALREMVERLQAEKAEAEQATETIARESGRRRRTRDEVMTPAEE